VNAATTTQPDTTPANGTPPIDPFAGLDDEVAKMARVQQSLVEEHTRHDGRVDDLLGMLEPEQRSLVETWHRRRFGVRQVAGRKPGQ
jgi:hypothetical protein